MDIGEQEVTRSRWADEEIWGQRGEGFCAVEVQAWVKGQKVKPGKQGSINVRK
jgi:hypothetical protein